MRVPYYFYWVSDQHPEKALFNLFMIQFPQYFFDVTGKMNQLIAATPSLDRVLALDQAKDFYSGMRPAYFFRN